MRLLIPYCQLNVEITDNLAEVIYIENVECFSKVGNDLWIQHQGKNGQIILSENDKELSISKKVECIINPFALDCNNKRVINRVYEELTEISSNSLQEETAEIRAVTIEYMDKLLNKLPYSLVYDENTSVSNILKAYNVRIDDDDGEIIDKIIEYLRTMIDICHVNIFIFFNLKSFISSDALEELYKFIFNRKALVVLVESIFRKPLKCEKGWIVDKDLCIIEV